MGSDTQQNRGMPNKLILLMIERVEYTIADSDTKMTRNNWVVFVTDAIISYVLSLRGNEGEFLNLDGLCNHINHKQEKYFIVTLLGKFKGENNVSEHTIQCINTTKSGINVKRCIEILLQIKK